MNYARPLAELRRQFEANPRLRLALPLIGALVAALLWQQLDGVRRDAGRGVLAEQAKLERMRSLQGQDAWIERAAEAAKVRDSLWAELPTVSTPGLAQAEAQTDLATLANSLGRGSEIRTEASVVADDQLPADVIRIRATLSGSMQPAQALQLLERIEGASNLAVIETADIRAGGNHSVSITYNAYFRQVAAEVKR